MLPSKANILWKLWNLVFFAGDVWVVVRWTWPDGITAMLSLGAPEYAFLITFFTGTLIASNWMWIRRMFPANRFGDLSEELQEIASDLSLGKSYYPGDSITPTPVVEGKIRQLQEKLNALNIESPNARDGEAWRKWVPLISGWASNKNLKAVRSRPPPPPSRRR